MLQMIAAGQIEELEAAWMMAVEEGLAGQELAGVLEALVMAGQLDTAETLGWALLEERGAQFQGPEQLALAQTVVSAVPISDELRSQAGQFYRRQYGDHPHFDALLRASGLISGQSPKRAFRTLDTALAIQAGAYLVNRFDHQVVEVRGYEPALGEFELTDAAGHLRRMEPKELADEFSPIDAGDFRVLTQHRPEGVRALLEEDPAEALKAICLAAGGRIDANAIREILVPAHLSKEQWSAWWNKARTAAKRSAQLGLEGRPLVVSYHPGGRTLEQEMAGPAAQATMPLERLEVLRRYAREVQGRKLRFDPAFARPIVESMAEQAEMFCQRSPADALSAALGIAAAQALDMPAPTREYPSPQAILASAADPAKAVAEMQDSSLWPAALEALAAARPDAASHLARLLRMAPAERLDMVAQRLAAVAGEEPLGQAAAEAAAEPLKRLELNLWLWLGPAIAPPGMPGKVELLRRMLELLRQLEKDHDLDRDRQRQIRQRIRAALAAGNYASYRQAVTEMDEAVAATIKNLIAQVSDGLAEAVLDNLQTILGESFYSLFARAKVQPWLDESAIWTTEAALRRRQAELKHLMDVKMLDNARAIGAAAEHGDLSENSEWRFAIEERDLLRAQAASIQDEINRARILRPYEVPVDSVAIGSRVHLVRADGQRLVLDLLGPWESDPARHVYNYKTPLAQALLGRQIGEQVTLKLGGEEAQYRIEALDSAIEPKG